MQPNISPGESGEGTAMKIVRLTAEEWRSVPGLPAYAVSSEGRIKRITPQRGSRIGRILNGCINEDGYRNFSLRTDGGSRTIRLHCVVAEAFLGPRPAGTEVNHIDGNKLNCAVSNLEYLTHADNMLHAGQTG